MDEVFFVILLFFRLKNEIILHSFFLFHTDSRGESTGEIQSSVCLFLFGCILRIMFSSVRDLTMSFLENNLIILSSMKIKNSLFV